MSSPTIGPLWVTVAGCVEPAISNHSVGWDPAPLEMQGRFGYGS
jgi:hypothetical protein